MWKGFTICKHLSLPKTLDDCLFEVVISSYCLELFRRIRWVTKMKLTWCSSMNPRLFTLSAFLSQETSDLHLFVSNFIETLEMTEKNLDIPSFCIFSISRITQSITKVGENVTLAGVHPCARNVNTWSILLPWPCVTHNPIWTTRHDNQNR